MLSAFYWCLSIIWFLQRISCFFHLSSVQNPLGVMEHETLVGKMGIPSAWTMLMPKKNKYNLSIWIIYIKVIHHILLYVYIMYYHIIYQYQLYIRFIIYRSICWWITFPKSDAWIPCTSPNTWAPQTLAADQARTASCASRPSYGPWWESIRKPVGYAVCYWHRCSYGM